MAEDGYVAKSIIEMNCPDVVITDIEMPSFNGLELICWIRQNGNRRISALPIVVMTSLEDPELEKIVCEVGANFVVRKPLSEDKFLRTMQEALAAPQNPPQGHSNSATKLEFQGRPSLLSRMARNAMGRDFKNWDDFFH